MIFRDHPINQELFTTYKSLSPVLKPQTGSSHPAAASRAFNVTDGGFHTLNEITEWVWAGISTVALEAALVALGMAPGK
jgi:hypothetical protein